MTVSSFSIYIIRPFFFFTTPTAYTLRFSFTIHYIQTTFPGTRLLCRKSVHETRNGLFYRHPSEEFHMQGNCLISIFFSWVRRRPSTFYCYSSSNTTDLRGSIHTSRLICTTTSINQPKPPVRLAILWHILIEDETGRRGGNRSKMRFDWTHQDTPMFFYFASWTMEFLGGLLFFFSFLMIVLFYSFTMGGAIFSHLHLLILEYEIEWISNCINNELRRRIYGVGWIFQSYNAHIAYFTFIFTLLIPW